MKYLDYIIKDKWHDVDIYSAKEVKGSAEELMSVLGWMV